MPPKRKRGGASARGRRGRPPKKLSQASESAIQSTVIEQNETSSSNSSVLEESAQTETKIKLETKIHKKFGKYHVPDEVASVKLLSPIIEDQVVSTTQTLVTSLTRDVVPSIIDVFEGGPFPVHEEDKMETEAIQDNTVHTASSEIENQLYDQMQHLEVTDSEEVVEEAETVEMQEVEEVQGVELESDIVLEYITNDPETEGDTEILYATAVEGDIEQEAYTEGEDVSQDEHEEVYYVVEEDSQDVQEDKTVVKTEPETVYEESQFDEELPVAEVVPKLEADENAAEEIESQTMEKNKKKEEKSKLNDKPCRKSKRISSRGAKIPEEATPITVEVPNEELKETIEIKIEPPILDSLDETIAMVSRVPEPEESLQLEDINMDTSEMSELKTEIKEELIEESPETEDDTKDIKMNKKLLPEKKRPGPKAKKIKDIKDSHAKTEKEQPKEEKKKGKKQVVAKVAKGKKGKDAKALPVSPGKVEKNDKPDEEDINIRRSSRIKTISTQKVRSRGKGLVKKDDVPETLSLPGTPDDKIFVAPTSTTDAEHKPVKVKSRWRRSSELEMRDIIKTPIVESSISEKEADKKKNDAGEVERRLKQFLHLKENVYLTERISCKEAKKMVCDCFLTEEEISQGEYGCGDDCLNRLLMIECGNLCNVGDRCTNKRFQKMQSATVEAFATERKGLGIRAVSNIPSGDFILEYVGEVLDANRFEKRAADYSKDKNQHYYFMSLRADAIIDATLKGNISRFINHSCEPNAETQKWTVNGELRIGFFSKRTILAGEEITFDYQFQRYGKEAQKCFCEAANCRGWLGEEPDTEDESEEEEEDEEDEEEEEEEEKKDIPPKEMVDDKEEKSGEEEVEPTIKPTVKKVVKKEKPPKKERRPRVLKPRRRKALIDRFEDLGLDEEIESLQSTGLKNQAQTLKLSRLIVRAKEPIQRTKLLKLLKKGEFPCRRLFLDYHGLRLIHGWMTDAQQLAQQDPTMESLRLEILQTLAMLPIPNKTMLQDSKVLGTVEKWSKVVEAQNSPTDSDSNSPKSEVEGQEKKEEVRRTERKDTAMEETSQEDRGEEGKTTDSFPILSSTSTPTTEPIIARVSKLKEKEKTGEIEDNDVRKSTGMEAAYFKVIPDYNVDSIKDELLIIFDDDFVPLEIPPQKLKAAEPEQPKYDILVEIMALALKLLEEWSSLKEVFRIPKKERIEQMKEHEREADRRYKALSVEQEIDRKRDRYRGFQRSSRIEGPDRLGKDRDRPKIDRYSGSNLQSSTSKLSKQERRELFARQAEEEERRRKQELWNKQNWMLMNQDPRMQGFDLARNHSQIPYVWNPQIGQFTPALADGNMQSGFPFPPPFTRAPGPTPHMDPTHGMPPGMLPPNVAQPNMPPANMGTMPPMPNIPPRPEGAYQDDLDDPSKAQFIGPIPPPVKLPPKWKTANDKYGRPYYYHVKLRQSQWEPPAYADLQEELEDYDSDSTSSSDTSSLSSSSSSEDSDSEDDTTLLMKIKNKFKAMEPTTKLDDLTQPLISSDDHSTLSCVPGLPGLPPLSALPALPPLSECLIPGDDMNVSDLTVMTEMVDKSMAEEQASPLEAHIAEPPAKKRRIGLVQEHIISPRTEEDRLQFREDVKKYKQNKEIVRKEKEIIMMQHKKHKSSSSTAPPPSSVDKLKQQKKKISTKTKIREMEANTNSEESKKIKEAFRTAMATVMVGILNPYRKQDCKEGRITATEDFKHLARKLTHFVMLKELKHCDRIEELECTESVKSKAKEFVRKYMSKFGEVYQRPVDETENF